MDAKKIIVMSWVMSVGIAQAITSNPYYPFSTNKQPSSDYIKGAAYFKVHHPFQCFQGPVWSREEDNSISLRVNWIDTCTECAECELEKQLVTFYDITGKALVTKSLYHESLVKEFKHMKDKIKDLDGILYMSSIFRNLHEIFHAAFELLDPNLIHAVGAYKIEGISFYSYEQDLTRDPFGPSVLIVNLELRNSQEQEVNEYIDFKCTEEEFDKVKKSFPNSNFSSITFEELQQAFQKHIEKDDEQD